MSDLRTSDRLFELIAEAGDDIFTSEERTALVELARRASELAEIEAALAARPVRLSRTEADWLRLELPLEAEKALALLADRIEEAK